MAPSFSVPGGMRHRGRAPLTTAMALALAFGLVPGSALADTASEPASASPADEAQNAQTPPPSTFLTSLFCPTLL